MGVNWGDKNVPVALLIILNILHYHKHGKPHIVQLLVGSLGGMEILTMKTGPTWNLKALFKMLAAENDKKNPGISMTQLLTS